MNNEDYTIRGNVAANAFSAEIKPEKFEEYVQYARENATILAELFPHKVQGFAVARTCLEGVDRTAVVGYSKDTGDKMVTMVTNTLTGEVLDYWLTFESFEDVLVFHRGHFPENLDSRLAAAETVGSISATSLIAGAL